MSPLDYDRLRDSLVDSGAVIAVAELHGGICGALCGGGEAAAQRWLADCLADQELTAAPAPVTDELKALASTSETMLAARELEFAPLLPAEDAPLEEQVEALAQWCQGFLNGLGTTAPKRALDVAAGAGSGAIAEILRDFAQISHAGLSEDEAAGKDQPDFALAEIQEYVRVSVQIVFEELAAARADAAPGHPLTTEPPIP